MNPVIEYLRGEEKRHLEELREYLAFPSVSAQPKHRKDVVGCAEWLRRHCAAMGLEARLVPTAGNPVVMATTRRRNGRRQHLSA